MSGWGCRYQYDQQCLRLRKECKPGRPGCVLQGKVTFARDLEAKPKPSKATTKKKPAPPRRKRKAQ
jgi:hypothetical protein